MHDLVIRNGTIHDGEGGSPYAADVAIDGDLIVAVMPAIGDRGRREIDASGLAIAPGFINVLSWAIPSLIADGRAPSDVHQGVTLEVFGEGSSMGPLTDAMRRDQIERQADIRYDIPWTTLREGLDHLTRLGVSVNVASFVGATTLRVHEVGYDDRPPNAGELERMRRLARVAAAAGARACAIPRCASVSSARCARPVRTGKTYNSPPVAPRACSSFPSRTRRSSRSPARRWRMSRRRAADRLRRPRWSSSSRTRAASARATSSHRRTTCGARSRSTG